jgi:hypothetical protein
MMARRITIVLATGSIAIGLAVNAAAQDEDLDLGKAPSWSMTMSLDAPNLAAPAVQFALFDEDPAPGFEARIKKVHRFFRKQLDAADDGDTRKSVRSLQMSLSWDFGFKTVTGDKVYLLTDAEGVCYSLRSSTTDGKKWFVTKTARMDGHPVCWRLPVQVKTGEVVHVELTEDNMFDLETAFDDAMQRPTSRVLVSI